MTGKILKNSMFCFSLARAARAQLEALSRRLDAAGKATGYDFATSD